MSTIILTVNKARVYDEVAKTASYSGQKRTTADDDAYNRMFPTDADRLMLERYWNETCEAATGALSPLMSAVSTQTVHPGVDLDTSSEGQYSITLATSNSYDTNLTSSLQVDLFTYFVEAILAKWYTLAQPTEVEGTVTNAAAAMENILRKLYRRKAPSRS